MTRTSDHPTVEAFAAVLFDMDGTLVDSDAATGATDLTDLVPRSSHRRPLQ